MRESAGEALDYLRSLVNTPEKLPDLILLDIRMPVMDGFGFLEEYGKLSESMRIKPTIMMLSSSLNQEDHEKVSKNMLVSKFLVKPLSKEKLSEIRF